MGARPRSDRRLWVLDRGAIYDDALDRGAVHDNDNHGGYRFNSGVPPALGLATRAVSGLP